MSSICGLFRPLLTRAATFLAFILSLARIPASSSLGVATHAVAANDAEDDVVTRTLGVDVILNLDAIPVAEGGAKGTIAALALATPFARLTTLLALTDIVVCFVVAPTLLSVLIPVTISAAGPSSLGSLLRCFVRARLRRSDSMGGGRVANR